MYHGRSPLTLAWTLLDSGRRPHPQVTPSSAHAERPRSMLGTGQYSSPGLVSSQVAFLIKLGRKSQCSHSQSLEPWSWIYTI